MCHKVKHKINPPWISFGGDEVKDGHGQVVRAELKPFTLVSNPLDRDTMCHRLPRVTILTPSAVDYS